MLAENYDSLFFDLDGVLFRGDEAVPVARETLHALRALGIRIVFLTNNSSRTPEQVAGKLGGFGIQADAAEVVTSAQATAELLAARGGGSVFAIGGDGVVQALIGEGLRLVNGDEPEADVVVVGIDEGFTYAKLRTACVLIRGGAGFVATNADVTYPAPGGIVWPGAGSLVAAVAAATGREPEVVGKPFAPLFEAALRRAGGVRPLVVGDRLDTDIEGANRLGWDSLLVLSGVATAADVDGSEVRPTHVAPDVSALLD
ncbi:MAG TPA: HAD-IIA family hydrolase [Gemmatimonadota bacterium]|nr:HAD-IIA family hydrolase [Gemmatimonadota bacterium]